MPAQVPVSPPGSARNPAAVPLPAHDIPAPLPTLLEGEDGLPKPPLPVEEEEQQQHSEQPHVQEQDKEHEQSAAAVKPPEEPVVDGIAGKHVFLFP